MTTRPRIEAFKVQGPGFDLVPSPPNRQWMDDFPDRHPYRCLPLAIANTHGWDVLCPGALELEWNGGDKTSDLTVKSLAPLPEGVVLDHFIRSHFSRGVFTFHTSYLFRTPKGWNTLVSGPFNKPKHGASPLTGIIETDWLPYPFTMNWQMTAPGKVRFEQGEPICTIMPIPKHYLEGWDVVIHNGSDDPVLSAEQQTFSESRDEFMKRLNNKDPEAIKQAWQRHYFVGRHPDGTQVDDHTNKVRLAEPVDKCGTKPLYAKEAPETEAAAKIMAAKSATPSFGCPYKHNEDAAKVAEKTKPKFWTDTSILNNIDQDTQTLGNIEGRKRVVDGVLTRSKNTLEITNSIDPASLDFVYQPNFISPEYCKILTDVAKTLADRQHVEDIKDPYWQGRILFLADIEQVLPEAAEIMRQAQIRVAEHLQKFFELTSPCMLTRFSWCSGAKACSWLRTPTAPIRMDHHTSRLIAILPASFI